MTERRNFYAEVPRMWRGNKVWHGIACRKSIKPRVVAASRSFLSGSLPPRLVMNRGGYDPPVDDSEEFDYSPGPRLWEELVVVDDSPGGDEEKE